jgi:hypothetical protein
VRALNVDAQALKARAIAGEKIPFHVLVFFDLPVPQRWAVGGTPLVWDGHTWDAQDMLIDAISDDVAQPSGLRFTLPAVTESQIALAVDDDVEGSEVEVYMAFVDPADGSVADAILVWAGELDIPGWQDGPEALAHFTAEHRGTIAMRSRPQRYTNSEQQRLLPGDTSLAFDPATDGAPLVWPGQSYFKVQE